MLYKRMCCLFLIGATIGLALGILYAPRSGKETREMLKRKMEEMREKCAKSSGKVV